MAAPERFAETSDSSCIAGAVHTWHVASVHCDAPVRSLSEVKRTYCGRIDSPDPVLPSSRQIASARRYFTTCTFEAERVTDMPTHRRRKIAQRPIDRRRMETLVIGAPLGLGVLVALGAILVMMAHLSE